MSTHDDQQLGMLLTDAVADVEPADRLGAIRTDVARAAARRRTARRTWLAGGGAVLAVAATVAVVALVSNPRPSAGPTPGPAGPPSQTPSKWLPPQNELSSVDASPLSGVARLIYYVGGPPEQPLLYAEVHRAAGEAPAQALELMTQAAEDPDYRTAWPTGAFSGAAVVGDHLEIQLGDPSLRTRPATMSPEEAETFVQQAIYTAQGAASQHLPVQFTYDGNPIDQVLGVPTSEPLTAAAPLDVLSHVNLTDPHEGATVDGQLRAVGMANSFEGTVPWLLEDQAGKVLDQGAFTAGWDKPRLFPFSGWVDVSSLDPGTYTLIVMTDDPSGGTEGNGPATDSRTIVVR